MNTIMDELDEIRTRLDKLYQRIDSINEAGSIKETQTQGIVSAIERMPEEDVADLIRPLAHTERVKILKRLREDGKYFTELINETGLSQSPLTFHLSILEKAGYVNQEFSRGRYLITAWGVEALRFTAHLYTYCERRK